jgi:hypothetical protein
MFGSLRRSDTVDSDYARLRAAARREVRDRMTELGHHVIGSWLSREFHLSRDGRYSFSDVDVVNTGVRRHREEVITIRPGRHELNLRVSIHANDCTDTVTPRGIALFAMLNVASAMLHGRCAAFSHYEVCKAYLVLARRHQSETYAEAANVHGPAGAFALSIKLGEVLLDEPRRDYPGWVSVRDAARRFVGSRDPNFSLEAGALAILTTGLSELVASNGDYPAWLQDYAIAKYSSVFAQARQGRIGRS